MPYVPKSRRKPYRAGKPPKDAKPREAPTGVHLPSERHLCYMLAAKGATDEEIEELCGVPRGTLAKWRKLYPSLDKAIAEGRTKPDAEVLYQFYRNATGYEYEEDQAVGGKVAQVLRVNRHARASVEAQKHWLAIRKEEWRPVQKHEHSGPNGTAIPIENRNQLIDSILAMVTSKPDPVAPKKGAQT